MACWALRVRLGKLEGGFPPPCTYHSSSNGWSSLCVALGQTVLQALGPEEGKKWRICTKGEFSGLPWSGINQQRRNLWENSLWYRGDCFRHSHLWMWNLKERVEFEGLALTQGKTYRLFLKFRVGIKHQTVLQKQQSEIWQFCGCLYDHLFVLFSCCSFQSSYSTGTATVQ